MWVAHESIVELDDQGLTARQIADRLGISTRTVQRVRVETGRAQGRGGGPRYTPEFLTTVDRLLTEGWPITEIAATYHVSHYNLRKHFPGRGWTPEQVRDHANNVRKMRREGVYV